MQEPLRKRNARDYDDYPLQEKTSMNSVSTLRLYLLRGLYLLLALGAGSLSWTLIFNPKSDFELMHGAVVCMLGAFSLLCVAGIFRPLQMLPVLFWEILWKCVWLARIALPAWQAGRVDDGIASNTIACSLVVLVIAIMPWPYVWRVYVRRATRDSIR